MRLGLDGAAAAFLASNLTYTCLMLGYKAWRETALRHSPLRTWSGWSLRGAFQGWGQYLQYGLPAAAMICCEWWVFEAVILMSGALPNADVAVAVMGISFHMTACAYMLPMGVGTAVSTLIGTELGAGDSRGARSIFNIGLSTVCCTQLLLGGGLYLGRAHLPRVFTGAPEVVRLVTHTMPAVSAAVVGDGLNALLSGEPALTQPTAINHPPTSRPRPLPSPPPPPLSLFPPPPHSCVLRGSGRQAWGAALNLVGYWGLGFPLAYYLGFTRHLDTLVGHKGPGGSGAGGFWSALALASAVQAGIQVVVVVCLDWELEARRARTRVEAHGAGTADVGLSPPGPGALSELEPEPERAPPTVWDSHLAAASSAGTSLDQGLVANLKHINVTLATRDAV
ncbi:hypothetical protein QJQ45_014098 [Haematococcus lacustris]|nr:hypothetical protein QJQ45_014098 [Haematococcus lacustris]